MLRIIWKAGCLETCTSGLGLGSGCNSPAYTTRPLPALGRIAVSRWYREGCHVPISRQVSQARAASASWHLPAFG
jgi:hypothetical protein